MNITNDMTGFRLNSGTPRYRIRQVSWDRYIEALEACLEAEEESRVYLELILQGKIIIDYVD